MRKLTIGVISFITFLGFMWMGLADAAPPHNTYYKKYLTTINPEFMIKPDEGYAWHLYKDEGGPTYAGSPSWKRFVDFVESKLLEYGVVDIVKNKWTYDYWSTTEWPGDGKWALISDGMPVTVASFGTQSGSTSAGGTTAQMVYYDGAGSPPASIAGKIVVYKVPPQPNPPYSVPYLNSYTLCDDEYRSDPETFFPMFTKVSPSVNNSYNSRWNFFNLDPVISTVTKGKAAGMAVVMDLPYDTVKGLRSHPTPVIYNCPTLFLDRVNGNKVIEDAKNGKTADLKLLATIEPKETYNFVGYLPGKNYGTEKDEMIGIVAHTDGGSLTQDNGALGILGVVRYFSRFPQSERPRTLALYVDCRHMMPGLENVFGNKDWYKIYPESLKRIKATVGLEHMGELEYREKGEVLESTGKAEISLIGVGNNQLLIDMTIKAVRDNEWPRCEVKCGERPGMNGQFQGSVKSIAGLSQWRDIPGVGFAGNWPGGHSQTTSRIDRFDKDLFWTQVAGMSQVVGELMLMDPVAIDYVWGELTKMIAALPDKAFSQSNLASERRDALLYKNGVIFNQVKAGGYNGAISKLDNDLKKKIVDWVVEANQAPLMKQIDKAIAKCSQAN